MQGAARWVSATIRDGLALAGVAFVALKGNIRVEGERDIQTKVMTTLFVLRLRRSSGRSTAAPWPGSGTRALLRVMLYSFASTVTVSAVAGG